MVTFFMLSAGFPVFFVAILLMVLPFLVGLFFLDYIAEIFEVFNSMLRGMWGRALHALGLAGVVFKRIALPHQ